ncbi:hypothetical protein CYMTET_8692 [Cymbomonas tetramitiformis]|uniref:Uncharacterized protein n=1 Tax=Cymbomonas tetramitiformis TaxID=36881 RepID=A0AAE0GSL5_9CHLO|nr:hypothetical protein CYMTET_8692 [Cymbomonas tetramitiformis]
MGPPGAEGGSRQTEERRLMLALHKEFLEMDPATLGSFPDRAKLTLPLGEQFAEQRNLSVQLAQARDTKTSLSKALSIFYSEKLRDVRLSYTKQAAGYPLESAHGVLDEQGHIRYTLLQNCTTIDGKNLDVNGFLADDFHITVGPLRATPKQAVELLGHMETTLRLLHGDTNEKHIINRQTPPRPRTGHKICGHVLRPYHPRDDPAFHPHQLLPYWR